MSGRRKKIQDTTSSIYQDAQGRWHGRVTVGRRQGKPHRVHVSRRTKSEVQQAVRELERRRDAGTYVWNPSVPTLAGWLTNWLDNIVPLGVKEKTLRDYSSKVTCHLIPRLGDVLLEDLTPEVIESAYADMTLDGASAQTVAGAHRVLRSALSEAVRRRQLGTNPALIARCPRVEEVEVEPLTRDEIRKVIEVAAHGENAARWLVALALGLRQGEALGLRWEDVDLAGGQLRVRKQLKRHNWKHGCGPNRREPICGLKPMKCPERWGGGLVLTDLKTRNSKRDVALPTKLAEQLEEHREVQARWKTPNDIAWNQHDLVFTTDRGTPIDPRNDGRAWHDLLALAGVRDRRLHDARHSHATLLLAQQVHHRVIMDLLGWSDYRMLARYTHVVDEMQRDAAARVNRALWGEPDAG